MHSVSIGGVSIAKRLSSATVARSVTHRWRAIGTGATVIPSTGPVAELWVNHSEGRSDDGDWAEAFGEYYHQQQPVVLRRLASEFPAVERWKRLDYLASAVGPNATCDCELGSYNQGSRLTIPFEDYLSYLRLWNETYGADDDSAAVQPDHLLYLAQNDLSAFGSLIDDVQIPFFCTDGTGRFGHGRLYSTMFWMGPRGSVSPLHFDPLDNVLVQVLGRKLVTLLPADVDAEDLYVGEPHGQQPNTSAVDVEDPNEVRFPRFRSLFSRHSRRTLLGPGDALFIPSRWWHHVRALDLSISVNAWWR